MDKNYYITTPIYYPSARPHMGHAYSSITADFFARFKRIDGFNVHFLNLLIDNEYYKKNKFAKNLLINFIELFFLKAYKLSRTKRLLLNFYHSFIIKIHNTEKFNLDEESLFLEFKSKILNG